MTDLEIAVQLLGGDTNKVIYDDIGMPSIMVRFDKGNISDVITDGSENTHMAFSVDGVEKSRFWYSKYQNTVITGPDGIARAYSLPLQDPKVYTNFDQAQTYCNSKGAGWHLGTNAEWAWIALQCRKNGFMPRGNNYYGVDASRRDESGIVTYTYDSNGTKYNGRVAAGSGPKSWAHNNDASGVWDLNGNIYEWVGGYRTVDGEIQVIPYNNAANRNNPQTAASTLWKAIMPDGSLVTPGTSGTLKWDYIDDPGTVSAEKLFQLNTTLAHQQTVDTPYGGRTFQSIPAASGVTVPEVLKALALFPADNGDHGSDRFYMRNIGERLAYRGGSWYGSTSAGVFYLYGNNARSNSGSGIGFRSAFIEELETGN